MTQMTNDQIRQNVRGRYQKIAVKKSKLPLPAAPQPKAAVTPLLILMPYPLKWATPVKNWLQPPKVPI